VNIAIWTVAVPKAKSSQETGIFNAMIFVCIAFELSGSESRSVGEASSDTDAETIDLLHGN